MAPNLLISNTPTMIAIVGSGFSGSLVAAHLLKTATRPLIAETAPKTIRGLLRRVRAEVATAAIQGYDWRSVTDALRPITQQLWQQLSRVEQQRFWRHLKPYWEVHPSPDCARNRGCGQ